VKLRAPLCSVAGCQDPPCAEFPLPEGYLAVACEDHKRTVDEWTRNPLGAPRGARLIGGHAVAKPPPGARILRHIACVDEGAVRHDLRELRR
jgi:hypothetical protein